jgi:hypothetical protein
MNHATRVGIDILREMLNKLASLQDKELQQTFYKKYFMTILEHVLGVMTDSNQVQFVGMLSKSILA